MYTSSYHLATLSSFFAFYDPHRELHSFPTRRSSDLHDGVGAGVPRPRYESAASARMASANSTVACTMRTGAMLGRTWRPSRSEEHTSELQSLRHLVCRLLLEKKKRMETAADSDTNQD